MSEHLTHEVVRVAVDALEHRAPTIVEEEPEDGCRRVAAPQAYPTQDRRPEDGLRLTLQSTGYLAPGRLRLFAAHLERSTKSTMAASAAAAAARCLRRS